MEYRTEPPLEHIARTCTDTLESDGQITEEATPPSVIQGDALQEITLSTDDPGTVFETTGQSIQPENEPPTDKPAAQSGDSGSDEPPGSEVPAAGDEDDPDDREDTQAGDSEQTPLSERSITLLTHTETFDTRSPELSEKLVPQDRDHQAALLDCFKRNAARPYPRYPQVQDRLYIPEGELRFDKQGRLILPFEPDKPYTVHNHPDNVAGRANGKALADIGQTLSDNEAARFKEEGYELTDRNFPLHPLWRSMLTNPDIRAVDSLGYYWQPGLNETTDVVAIAPVKIDDGPLCLQGLFALRDDTQQWALAGGDIDSGETPLGAALRETAEETHVDLSAAEPTPLTRQIVADPRTTLVTGAITQPFLCMLPELPAQTPRAGDETSAAAWRPVTAKFLGELFASHNLIVEEAVRAYEQTHGVTVLQNGRIVRDPKA